MLPPPVVVAVAVVLVLVAGVVALVVVGAVVGAVVEAVVLVAVAEVLPVLAVLHLPVRAANACAITVTKVPAFKNSLNKELLKPEETTPLITSEMFKAPFFKIAMSKFSTIGT